VPDGVAQQITVAVRLFASYREQAGRARLSAEVPEGARVRDLEAQLAAEVPALTTTRGLVAVNQTYVGPDFVLHQGDEVAFIPPVSGGQADPPPRRAVPLLRTDRLPLQGRAELRSCPAQQPMPRASAEQRSCPAQQPLPAASTERPH
jgi:molybdopterin converting factor subunit 1